MNKQTFLFRTRESEWSQDQFRDIVDRLRRESREFRNVAVHSSDPILINAALVLGIESSLSLRLLHSFFTPQVARELAAGSGAEAIISGTAATSTLERLENPNPNPCSSGGWIGVYTSATSGAPKLTIHSLDKIQSPARFVSDDLAGSRWLMCYSPTSYAGLQVFFSARKSGGAIVYQGASRMETASIIHERGVQIISATPTFWRLLISTWPPEVPCPVLKQATLGGEVVQQTDLDLVRGFFSPKRLTHIYASSETGPAIIVSDGLAGFPTTMLTREGGAVDLRVRDGHLEIRSDYGMRAYADLPTAFDPEGWYRTPDRVDVIDARAYFRGRADTLINIGGRKVPAEEIEHQIQSIRGVLDCAVFERSSPITGSLTQADVVLSQGTEMSVADLKKHMRSVLPSALVPQYVRLVAAVQIAQSGKKNRS